MPQIGFRKSEEKQKEKKKKRHSSCDGYGSSLGSLGKRSLCERISCALERVCTVKVVVAEWLRRWTRNPLGSPRAGSNPADYVYCFIVNAFQCSITYLLLPLNLTPLWKNVSCGQYIIMFVSQTPLFDYFYRLFV